MSSCAYTHAGYRYSYVLWPSTMDTIMIMHTCVCVCACMCVCVHACVRACMCVLLCTLYYQLYNNIFHFNTVSMMPVVSTPVVSISHTVTSIIFTTPSGMYMFTVSVSQPYTYILVIHRLICCTLCHFPLLKASLS